MNLCVRCQAVFPVGSLVPGSFLGIKPYPGFLGMLRTPYALLARNLRVKKKRLRNILRIGLGPKVISQFHCVRACDLFKKKRTNEQPSKSQAQIDIKLKCMKLEYELI